MCSMSLRMEYPCRGCPARLRRISITGSVRGNVSIMASSDMSYSAILSHLSSPVKEKDWAWNALVRPRAASGTRSGRASFCDHSSNRDSPIANCKAGAAPLAAKLPKSCTILPVIARSKFFLAAAAVLLLGACAWAEKTAELKPTGYVNDFANVLDQGTRAQMEDICRQVDQNAHAQIAVVTIKTLDGSDVESYAVDLFKQWGVGAKSSNRGVLILYAIQDHRARVEVGYGLEPILPDGKVGGFQREAIPLVRAEEYSQALLLVTSRVADVIAADAGVQLTGTMPRPPTRQVREPGGGMSLGGIILLVIVFLVILFTPLRSI